MMMTTNQSPERTQDEHHEADLPQFASVMRGYDRGQVDDYVARLNDFLDDAEQRANRSERSLADSLRRNERLNEELRQAVERQHSEPTASEPFQGLGERVETILRLAAEEADALRARGRDDASEMVEQATRRREQEVVAAEKELQGVARRRDGVVAELRRVQDVLATLGLREALAEEALTADGATSGVAETPTDEVTTASATDPDETTVIDMRAAEGRVRASG
jgi:DivIVA domain-containing protein